MIKIYSGRKTGSKKHWVKVVRFETEPREHPIISNEGEVVAKFIGVGDAWEYAKNKIAAHDPNDANCEPLFGYAIL